MALSEHEQQLLDEMERRFYQSEADVVNTGSGPVRRLSYRSLVLGIVVVVLGIGVLIGGVAAQQLWLGLIGFIVMLGGVMLVFARGSSAPAADSSTSTGSPDRPSKAAKESLSERMERRWDQRMEGER